MYQGKRGCKSGVYRASGLHDGHGAASGPKWEQWFEKDEVKVRGRGRRLKNKFPRHRTSALLYRRLTTTLREKQSFKSKILIE